MFYPETLCYILIIDLYYVDMIVLSSLIIFWYHVQSVSSQTPGELILYLPLYLSLSYTVIIRSPVNQSVCVGGTVNFTCAVMFTSGLLGPANWFTNNGNIFTIALPGHTRTDDSNGRSAPANVTTVLTVTNVSISDNEADYFCAQGLNERSDTVFLTVFGKFRLHIHTYVHAYVCVM